jgi:hypothetical protein
MNNNFYIRYYADSLGLPRQNIVDYNNRYIKIIYDLLKNHFSQELILIDRCRGGYTLEQLFEWYMEDEGYYFKNTDILIVHAGICDCAPRPIPYWLRSIIARMPNPLKKIIISFLHKYRSLLQSNGIIFYRTNQKKFTDIVNKWLEYSAENTKRIYYINIAPTNENFAAHSPGLQKAIKNYNNILKNTVLKYPNASLIDIFSYILNDYKEIDKYIVNEDGHHITETTHSAISNLIVKKELGISD